jgi:acetyl-CoA carboxylase biotin carboxyl carrier protein
VVPPASPKTPPASSAASAQAKKDSAVDQALIRDLAALLDETGLSEIEIERAGLRVRVARGGAAPVSYVAAPAASSAPAGAGAKPALPTLADHAKNPGAITSPMVGTAYAASSPGARPFVDVGDAVKAGQTICIIEAMKTMNQIPATRAGTVTQILFEDGQPVEFGEPLMIIE